MFSQIIRLRAGRVPRLALLALVAGGLLAGFAALRAEVATGQAPGTDCIGAISTQDACIILPEHGGEISLSPDDSAPYARIDAVSKADFFGFVVYAVAFVDGDVCRPLSDPACRAFANQEPLDITVTESWVDADGEPQTTSYVFTICDDLDSECLNSQPGSHPGPEWEPRASTKSTTTTQAMGRPRRIANGSGGIWITWPAVRGAEGYEVRYWKINQKRSTKRRMLTDDNLFHLSGHDIAPNTKYVFRVVFIEDGEVVGDLGSPLLKVISVPRLVGFHLTGGTIR